MAAYKTPLADIQFLLNDLLDYSGHYSTLPGAEEVNAETINMILEESAKFSENVIHPLSRPADEEGCHFENGEVTLPKGLKEARELYIENGWAAMVAPTEWGGQGIPNSLGTISSEAIAATNPPFAVMTSLPTGVATTIETHASQEQKETYLPKLIDGCWGATMCLTEPQAGTDLGLLKTTATRQEDGTYKIAGSKCFISFGEHDATENIIHLVLARCPDAPEATAGISLFIVPKLLLNTDGSNGNRNAVSCGSIEHKMGLHASPTCVMNFDDATGFLIGDENNGLEYMFTLMNDARIASGISAIGFASASFQGAVAYAHERLQMRSLSGAKNPEGPADPIIVHPGVRQLLLTQKAFIEGCRAFTHDALKLADISKYATDEKERREAYSRLGYLTPILKGFITEVSNECVNAGLQAYGAHGYVRENGMEQLVRDCRVTTMFEGTTQIQSLDLLGRKTVMNQGKSNKCYIAQVQAFCDTNCDTESLKEFISPLADKLTQWQDLTQKNMTATMTDLDEMGAASVDYLMYSGYVVLAYYWAQMAKVANEKLKSGDGNSAFYQAKLQTARFYYQRLLPRTNALAVTMTSGAANLMDMDADSFVISRL